MITNLKPYTSMKDSGIPWLGEIPSHWDLRRAKWLFTKRDRPVRDTDEVITCFRDGTVTLRKNRRARGFTESLKEIGYQGIRRGDLVIHGMDAFAGAIGVADSAGKGSPVYSVCNPESGTNANYYAHTLREMARSRWIEALARGVRERSTDFRFGGFAIQQMPVPPAHEQTAIVRFLDHANRWIRRYIQAKRKLIQLLEEEKQATIHHAVTRGLNPDVRLRPSGVKWFGDVPEHWQVVALRRVIRRAVDGPHHSPSYVDDGIPFLSARNIRPDGWSLDDAKYISESDYKEFSKRVVPEPGDVLYTKGGTTGIARAVDLPFRFQVWVHVAVLKVIQSKVRPQFLATALNSPRCYDQSQLLTRGATNQDLGLGRMKDIILPLPPLREQKAILARLAEATRRISNAIHHARKEISLLREYRTRLIADVVTGKLDVRAAAAQLPDVTEDADLIDHDPDELTAEDAEFADDPDPILQEADA